MLIFAKAHIQSYTKHDGTFVSAHEDTRRHTMVVVRRPPSRPNDPVAHMLSHMVEDPKSKWGIRIFDEPVADKTAVMPLSRKWTWEGPTKRYLTGTSTVGIVKATREAIETALKHAGILPHGPTGSYYPGKYVYLVKGDSSRRGVDDGERVLTGARVIAEYTKENDERGALLPVAGK